MFRTGKESNPKERQLRERDLSKRRLPSGVRLGPPWPVRLLNLFGPLVKALGLWPRIDPDRMLRAIERRLKRNDWPEPLLRALPQRAAAFNDDAKPSLFGALVLRDQFKKSAMNALGFEDLIARHPEILDERIERPLFVVGLARTGTTLLQRLLSLHQGARFLPFWEAYSPVPYKLGKHKGGRDGRHGEGKRKLRLLKWVGPEFNKIHPIEVDDPEECYHLFRSHFLIPPGFDFGYVPSYWQWFDAQAFADTYRMHKRQLQALQWLDGRQHWVLKCPNHLSGLQHLLKVYPDARIVYTHRDPERIVASLCSLAAVTWSMTSDDVDLGEVAEFALDTAERCQAAASAALQLIPRDQIIHMDYDAFIADPVAGALGVYERFGYPADAGLKARMQDWLAAHPSDKHGKHRYQLSDYGLTPEDVHARLKGPGLLAAGGR